MRLLSYSSNRTSTDQAPNSYGLVSADGAGIINLNSRINGASGLGDLIEQGRLYEAHEYAQEPADIALSDVVFERLLERPRKIFCIGVNYGGRNAEYEDKSDAAYPSVFVRFADSFTGHEQPLMRPPESEQLDYEGEIVVVIGKSGRRIPVDEARSHIAGVTLGNEGTIRDWVRHAKFNVTQGKNWESSGSFGPWLTPIEELGDFASMQIQTHVNGELRQSDSPATMKYSIEYQIHYLSTFATLNAGDVIFTGTPTGAGARQDPPVWLKPGDIIEVSVAELGTLRNTVADEFEPGSDGSRLQAPEAQ